MTNVIHRTAISAALLIAGATSANAHSAGEVFDILQNHGYSSIQFTDSSGPDYMANACREGIRYHFHVNNYGDVTQRREVGACGRRANFNDGREPGYHRSGWRHWGWRNREDNDYRRYNWRTVRPADY